MERRAVWLAASLALVTNAAFATSIERVPTADTYITQNAALGGPNSNHRSDSPLWAGGTPNLISEPLLYFDLSVYRGATVTGTPHLQFWLERSLASNVKFRFGIVFLKNRKSAQARRNALFRNQPARLDDSPFSPARWLPIDEWKFIERDTRAIDSQFFRRTTQVDQSVYQ